jgi:nickel/cobalt exporter
VRRRALAVAVLTGALLVALASLAAAHPLGNFTVNRYTGLVLSPGEVRIGYVLDMAEIPTFQVSPQIDKDGDGTPSLDEMQAWADLTAAALLSNLTLTISGDTVPLSIKSDRLEFRPGQADLPILRLEAIFTTSSPESGSIEYRDSNYADRIGWKEITVTSTEGVAIADSSVPASSVSDELQAYPSDLLSSPLDVTQATFGFHPGLAAPAAEATPPRPTVANAPVASGGSFANLVHWRLTPLVLFMSLLLAFAFGAVHALGPGHGKTITAAYLVGTETKSRQAALVGIAVSLMHTGSVLALGFVFLVLARSFPPEKVYPWLELVTGLTALGLGTGLFVMRLRSRRRGQDSWRGHSHPWEQELIVGGHSHSDAVSPSHAHEGDHELVTHGSVMVLERETQLNHDESDHTHPREPQQPPKEAFSAKSLAALAVAGGILPSPTAFVVLLGAIRAHRPGYGLSLIFAFSAGLAGALVFVGLFALRARTLISNRLHGRWASSIPVASAAVIMGFGAFFALRGVLRIS